MAGINHTYQSATADDPGSEVMPLLTKQPGGVMKTWNGTAWVRKPIKVCQ